MISLFFKSVRVGEFEAPPKFDPSEFKWGSQTGSNLSMFAPASFGDNKLGSQASNNQRKE